MFSNTISFDAHVLQVFPPLTVGASLIVAKPEGHFDPSYMVDMILSHGITGFMFTVPTLVSWRWVLHSFISIIFLLYRFFMYIASVLYRFF